MKTGFVHNDLRYYVRALYDMAGIDVRFMVPDYEDVVQLEPGIIEQKLQEEDTLNAQVMSNLWLYKDRALEAISMRESDGYSGLRNAGEYYSDTNVKRDDGKAYIPLARTNAEKSKGHLYKVPLNFEIVARNPERDQNTVEALNLMRNNVLNDLHYEQHRKDFISDGHDFGSGILFMGKRKHPTVRNFKFLETRAKQGQPLTWEEYEQMEHALITQEVAYIPTFEVIRDRRAKGEQSMDFENDCHTIITWMQTVPVAVAAKKYPEHKDSIKAGICNEVLTTNPAATRTHDNDSVTTVKHTWIPMPVRYPIVYKVDVGNGILADREQIVDRKAWLHIERLENVGIVAMAIDEYAHGDCPLTMWFRRPSKLHAYGIGAFKDMHSPEWAFNLAFNGKFKWFKSSSKNTKYVFKGALTPDQVKATKSEGTVVEIDVKTLPTELRTRPISELLHETPVGAFPSMYDNLERDMIYHIDRQGEMVSNEKAYSGRQQALQDFGNETTMSPIVSNLEVATKIIGEKFFSNIVDDIGDTPLTVMVQDPITKKYDKVELNIPLGEIEQLDPITFEQGLYAYDVKNGVRDLQFDTQISTTSIMPINPTEQRFWIQDTMATLYPYTQDAKGLLFIEMMNTTVYGGMFTKWIERMQELDAAQQEAMAAQNQQQVQLLQQEQERDYGLKMQELQQNAYRLEAKATSDQDKATAQLMNAMVQFMGGDKEALDGFL